MNKRKSLEERFWEKVDKKGSEECWEWKAGISGSGYGTFWLDGKSFRTNRVSYELFYGKIPPDMFICHHCDNPKCVNPTHLFLGTNSDNMMDAVKKGKLLGGRGDRNGSHTHPERVARGDKSSARLHPESVPRGESHHWARLDDDKVKEIRQLYANGTISQQRLAIKFGVTQSAIWAIVNKKTWRHIK
jgi:hypothetical protein